MAGARQDDQAGRGDGALEHQRGLVAPLVFVADQQQDRDRHLGELAGQREQGRPGRLHAAHGQGGAQGVVPGERRGELGPAARVLVLELDPGRADRVALGHLGRALGLERVRNGLRLGAERVGALGFRAVSGPGDHRRAEPVRVVHGQVQRGEAAHGQADRVGLVDAQAVQHRDRVGDRAGLRVGARIGGHLRGRVPARRVGDAAVAGREEPDLRLPAPVIAGELVDEQQRLAQPGLLGVQRHAVVRHDPRDPRHPPSLVPDRSCAHDVLVGPRRGSVGVALGQRLEDRVVLAGGLGVRAGHPGSRVQ